MTDLIQTIKKAAIEAMEASEPTGLFVGRVESEEPLRVRLNQRLTLSEERILFLKDEDPPEEDDKLALLCFQGGQRYLVLGYLP